MKPTTLKQIRSELGMTQAELGGHLRISGRDPGRTVRKWEAGDRAIQGPVVVALAYTLATKQMINDTAGEPEGGRVLARAVHHIKTWESSQ